MPQYLSGPPLNESEVAADPLEQFQRWMAEAVAAQPVEPTAMALATVSADGRPSLRMVLFKGFHDGGFCFYTNYSSRKGDELATGAHAALTFWWDRLERQVRIEGAVERLPRVVSERYFHSRPRGSQLAAYVSQQSAVLGSRAELEARVVEGESRFDGQEIPCPEHWGGYRVMPEYIEFWQGRRDRLHDRLVYRRDGGAWALERLQP